MKMDKLLNQLCVKHPLITRTWDTLGGEPRIDGLRLSVGDVISALYTLGSIEAVVNIYKPDLTEAQVKSALAFAQDFLESLT